MSRKNRHPLVQSSLAGVRSVSRAVRRSIHSGSFASVAASTYLERYTYDGDIAPLANAATSDLERQFYRHSGRPVVKWQHYLPIYEKLLAPYRDGSRQPDGKLRPLRMLEIGVFQGGSLQFWRTVLGPEARICGIDIDERCRELSTSDLPVRIGSQADGAFLREVVKELGGVDVVLDDGSHRQAHIRASFDALFPLLSDGGLYIVEDTHACYWPEFGGGVRRGSSFTEHCKRLVDDINGWYHEKSPARANARDEIESVTFFNGIIAITKKRQATPRIVKVP